MADVGSDISCLVGGDGVWDLDPTFTVVSGQQVLLESMARALQTSRGLMGDEPDRGLDLAELENARAYPGSARALQASISMELLRDERIAQLSVSVRVEGDVWAVMVEGSAETGIAFRYTLSIDGDSVSILTGATDG